MPGVPPAMRVEGKPSHLVGAVRGRQGLTWPEEAELQACRLISLRPPDLAYVGGLGIVVL